MNDPTTLQPLPDPSEDPMAALLTEVLSSEASRVDPGERLDQIRDRAAQHVRRPGRRWATVVAGAAAIALVGGGGAWVALDHDGGHSSATAPPVTGSPSPTAPSTPSTVPSASSSPNSSAAIGTWSAPIYFPGRNTRGLFREFHRLPVTPGPVVAHIADAFRVAMNPAAVSRPSLDFSPWLAGTSRSFQVSMTGPDTVLVTLPDSERTARGATTEQARLAAQQLVWTASAVAQDAGLGVRIAFAHGSGRLFGVLPVAGQTFHRPPSDRSYEDLSAIWILQPADGARVGSTVTLSGQACTFEANVRWEITRGGPNTRGPVLRTGHTTATSGCPIRGTWKVVVSGLAPGTYGFRADEPSAKGDGTYEGLDTLTFVVR